ncbi:uncharacterized protein LOC130986763 isoform X2 [Salvia miltiorrhiza]|uniref:uncharacterized protein LOC130986763 isoform X2 n=1 Tax=Salvia miltiorrhiza TaxID=226208 RepID=UPI0025ACDD50|nr:uncharacterized protein LOC130986763 isoform X2 [Salvia miltiorrhiza]
MSEPSITLSPQPIDLNFLQSRIAELRNVDEKFELGVGEVEKLTNDVGSELERKIDWISSEWFSNLSSLTTEDLNETLGQLKKELSEVEGENVAIEREVEELQRRCVEDYDKLDTELEKFCCSLEFIESQNEGANENAQIDLSSLADDCANPSNEHGSNFKILELSHQIEKNKTTLKSLQDLDSIYKRFEAVEKIGEAFTGVKVIEIEGNNIRLSLKTYIPYLETVLHRQDIESIVEPLELNHELTIEIVDDTWELKNAEIFPNDVYIGDILDATKAFRQLYSAFSVIETRSSLEFLVRRVQDRIAMSSLRRFVVKHANKSRHSFEYLDKEDTIVAHLVGGVDAFIKLPQGWPLSDLALELISLKSTSQYSKEISLSFLRKMLEMANSMNAFSRHNILIFADRIEEILTQQMREEV